MSKKERKINEYMKTAGIKIKNSIQKMVNIAR